MTTEIKLPNPLPADPLPLATDWLHEAWDKKVQRNPNCMVLATVDANAVPSARVVLCREIVAQPGYFSFYASSDSRKAREFRQQPFAAAVFHWDAMRRMVRVEGPIVASPEHESEYFSLHPWHRRNEVIPTNFCAPPGSRPQTWGGYRLWAAAIELWTEDDQRRRENVRWTRKLEPVGNDEFKTLEWSHQKTV